MRNDETIVKNDVFALPQGYDAVTDVLTYMVETCDHDWKDAATASTRLINVIDGTEIIIAGYLVTMTPKGWLKLYVMDMGGKVYSTGSKVVRESLDKIIKNKTALELSKGIKVIVKHLSTKDGSRTFDNIVES